MKKNNLFVLLALLIVFASLYLLSSGSLFAIGYVSSVSQVNLVQDSQVGQAWRVEVINTGGGDSALVGYVTPEQLRDSASGKTAKYGFSVSTTPASFYCDYPLSVIASKPISRLDYVVYDYIELNPLDVDKNFEKFCYSRGMNPYYLYKGVYPRVLGVCLKETQLGYLAGIGTPTEYFKTTISTTIQGQTKSVEINNREQQRADLGDFGYVVWSGSRWAGVYCPSSSGLNAVYDLSKQKYSGIVQSTSYSAYQSARSVLDSCISNRLQNRNPEGLGQCFNPVNDAANTLLTGAEASGDWRAIDFSKAVGSSPFIRIDRGNVGNFPSLLFTLKVAWLGVVESNGVPELSCREAKCQAGGSAVGEFGVLKNVGSQEGSFAVSVDCGNDVSVISPVLRYVSLKPNEVFSIKYPITASRGGEFSCSVKAVETTNGKTASCSSKVVCSAVCSNSCPENYYPNPNNACVCEPLFFGAGEDCSKYGAGWTFSKSEGKCVPPFNWIYIVLAILIILVFATIIFMRR